MIKDSKARFQQPTFKSKLVEARSYKRTAKGGREEKRGIWEAMGLGTPLSRSLAILGIAMLAGLIYWPPLFFVRMITISGNESLTTDLQILTRQYFDQHRLSAQQNIFFLSKIDLAQNLKNSDNRIKSLSIRKKYFHELDISVITRKETYGLQTPEKFYILSDDGFVLEEDDASTSSLTLVKIKDSGNLAGRDEVFTPQILSNLQTFLTRAPAKIGSSVGSFEMNSLPPTQLTAYTAAGWRIITDPEADAGTVMEKIAKILERLDANQKNQLLYLDMRLAQKTFACFKNTPCAKDSATVSTSTDTSTNILIP